MAPPATAVGGWLAAFAGILAFGAALIAVLVSASPAPGGLTILSVLAALGIFLLFAYVAGHIRLGGRIESEDLTAAVVDNVEAGLVVTSPTGQILLANAAADALIGWSTEKESTAFDAFFARSPATNEAYFRLCRSIQLGVARSESVSLQPQELSQGDRHLRISVRPVAGTTGSHLTGCGLWVIEDITQERRRAARQLEAREQELALYSRLPAGVLMTDATGRVTFMNERLRSWLAIERDPRASELNVGDLVAGDGADLLMALAQRDTNDALSIDLDLIQENGAVWPATVIVQPAPTSAEKGNPAAQSAGPGLAALVLERALSRRDDETASGPLATESFARFFRSAPFGIAVISPSRTIVSSNAAFSRLLLHASPGRSGDALAIITRAVDEGSRPAIEAAFDDALSGKANIPPLEVSIGSGELHTRRLFFAPLPRSSGGAGSAVVYVIDATEQKALEMKFAQSQKMEVIGNLAGGVAHDFNNVMTAIIGFADLLLGTHRPGDPAYQKIREIRASADRAADLVHNLLAFSRQQQLQPKVMQLQELITDVSVMVKRALGEDIELKIVAGRDLWLVKADRGELTRVIMNLAVNARDAMPEGGRLTIRTRNVSERDAIRNAKHGLIPGAYVLIEVEDTGIGMPPEVLEKIFEPFFTTKAVGKGTGLGLSTVYGIVKQTGGYIVPESTPGQGTIFRIYLPRVEAEEIEHVTGDAEKVVERDLTGAGRVLIVEDEDAVRRFAVEALKRQGYTVMEACDGLDALELLEEQNFAVDLIVSDVKMPEMDGPALLQRVRQVRPELKFVFVSGYADDGFSSSLADDPNCAYLAKPYSLAKIAATVKEQFGR